MMKQAIEAKDVYRKYGDQEVLKGLSLSVAPGEFVALMGPSGSGKSTFLHLAAGLLAADAGTVRIGETEVTALGDAAATKFRRRHVGVVFQAFNLLETLTVTFNPLSFLVQVIAFWLTESLLYVRHRRRWADDRLRQ